jgi:hypothetical protein
MTINVSDLLSGNTRLEQDPSPNLSADLNVNGNSIVDNTGPVNIDGLNYPIIDGPLGSVITSDGSGNLALSSEPPIYQSEKAAPLGVATLNLAGKIYDSQIPSLAITDVFVVTSEAEMLGLGMAQLGDVAIRTDQNLSYILRQAPPSILSNWEELLDRPDLVTSVHGRTGAVVSAASDYDAVQIDYDNTVSGLVATDVQGAIDEAEARLDTVEGVAGTAVQPGDNITVLVNNANYISNITAEPIGDLADVDVTGISPNDVLIWNGTNFVPVNPTIVGPVLSVFGRTGTVTAQASDYDAVQIDYSNTTSGLTATDVQAAIDEVEGRVDTVEGVSGTAVQPGDNMTTLTNDANYISNITAEPIGDLADVDVTGISTNDVLQWNGSNFVPASTTDISEVDSVFGRTGTVTAQASDYDAVQIDYSNATSSLTATDVQAAIDEVEGRVDTVEGVAGTAVQPGDNITTLTNDANYISNITAEPIGDLADVDVTGISTNDVLQWNGSNFVPVNPTTVGPVLSVFGRTGTVTAQASDYDAVQIDYSNTTSGLTATNSQAAIDELDGRIDVIEGSFIPSSQKGVANGVATLGADGLIPNAQIPPLAITETFVVPSEAAMLALSDAETGDIAVRTDMNKSFILAGNDFSVLADWQELLTPTDTVLSVNGQTGVVVLSKTDIGLGNVDNTSDLDKPVSTSTQNALNTKADKIIPVTVGNIATLDATGNLTDSGILSSNVIVSGDNISVLTNDSGFISNITAEPIGDLSDVDVTGISTNDVLQWNGSSFVPVNPTTVGPVASVFGRTGTVTAQASDYDAVQIDYSNTTSGLTATDVQAAIDEIDAIADTAIQPGDNITTLTNDANYISNITAEPIGDLADVDVTGISTNDVLQWNGSNFVPVNPTTVGPVASVFGRTGTVTAQASDYDADQVDYDNTVSGLVATDVQAAIDEIDAIADTAIQPGDNISVLTNDSGFISDITGENLTDLSDVNVVGITDGQVLSYNSSTTDWEPTTLVASEPYCLHNGAVTQVLSGTNVTLLFGATILANANYTYASGVINVPADGVYEIDYTAGCTKTGGGFLSTGGFVAGVYVNGTVVSGSEVGNQTANNGILFSASKSIQLNLLATDNVEIRINSTIGNTSTAANGSSIKINRIS